MNWLFKLFYTLNIAWFISMGYNDHNPVWYVAAMWCFFAWVNDEFYFKVRRMLGDVLTQLNKMEGRTVK